MTAAVMETYARQPLTLVSGRGCRVTDADRRTYLDLSAGIAVSALGHAHPAVVDAVRAGAEGLLHVSNLVGSEPMAALASRLAAASGMDRVFFCNSGTEAVEAALKLARKARPGRPEFVVFEGGFHGRTMGALSATARARYQEPFRPLVPGFVTVPFGDPEAAARAIGPRTAAVLVEPVQGEGGVRPGPPGFLACLRRLCDGTGALLLLDEVQTGVGRTGTFYAFQAEAIAPDAVASAKGLAGGLPMGALLARGEAAVVLRPGDHGCTFGGGPFVSRVALAVVDTILAPGFLDGVRQRGTRLLDGMRRLAARHPRRVAEARGRGFLLGLVLRAPEGPAVLAALRERGVLATTAGDDVVRLTPPLVLSDAEVDEALSALDGALAGARAGVEA